MPTPDTDIPRCALCGEPMPPGEEMFKYHGYSGPCPKPPLPRPPDAIRFEARGDTVYAVMTHGEESREYKLELRDAALLAHELQAAMDKAAESPRQPWKCVYGPVAEAKMR